MLTRKFISLLLSTFALLFSNTAQADFRKALDAYFERDGEVMMKEVMHAVEVGNTDGLSLFLSILEKDSVIQHSILFYFQSENREILHRIEAQYDEKSISKTFSHQQDNYAPWVKLINSDRHVLFLRLLEQASKKGTKTDQNRYLNIRYPYGFFKHSSSKEGAEYRKRIKALKLKDHPIKAALIKLSTRLAKSESKSEQKKLYKQLALTISKPNASYFYADITANMVNYYIKKNTRASFKQAYLWMILGLKKDTSVEDYCCIFKTYLAFDKAKGFEKLGLDKVKTQWKKAKEFNDILKSITDIAEPDLIKQNQMVNLKRQPALSFHQFNNDFQQVKNGVTVKNYLIDIYTDGRIYLSIGPQRDRTQNKELFTMLSQKEVNKLLNEFDRLGFEQAPDRTFVGARSSYHMSDIERVHGLSGALQPSTYFITRRKQGTERTVIYDMLEIEKLPFPAKVLTLLENQLQTQKYRCGTIKDRSYYDFCVDKDNGFKLIAQ